MAAHPVIETICIPKLDFHSRLSSRSGIKPSFPSDAGFSILIDASEGD
jgi:hypothetical protein